MQPKFYDTSYLLVSPLQGGEGVGRVPNKQIQQFFSQTLVSTTYTTHLNLFSSFSAMGAHHISALLFAQNFF